MLAADSCKLAARAKLAWLMRARFLTLADDLPVWPIPCFSCAVPAVAAV